MRIRLFAGVLGFRLDHVKIISEFHLAVAFAITSLRRLYESWPYWHFSICSYIFMVFEVKCRALAATKWVFTCVIDVDHLQDLRN